LPSFSFFTRNFHGTLELFHIAILLYRALARMVNVALPYLTVTKEFMLGMLLRQGLTILYLAGWCLITMGVGRLCLSAAAISYASRGEALFLSAGIGLVTTGYTVFLLGITRSLHPSSLHLLILSVTLISLVAWRIPVRIHATVHGKPSIWDRPAAVLLCILLLAGFSLAMTPETGKDALIYHLAAPKLYLLHQGFYFIPGNVFAGYPLLGEMHYLLALFLQDDILAKAMNYAVLIGILLGIGLFARSLMSGHAFPATSMLIFASIPSVFFISHTAYNDLFVAFFTLAALYTFLRWTEGAGVDWLIMCGIFSGSAAACKYTALLLTPLGCLGVLWLLYRRKAGVIPALRHTAIYVCAAFVAGSPFYLKNWIVTGNPFYPFFYELFGGLSWDADQARLYDLFLQGLGMGRRLTDYLLLPWNLSFRARAESIHFDGILGPIFILTLPFLLGRRRWGIPIRVVIVYVAVTFLFWASSAQQIRYLIPLLALLAIVTGAILTRYRGEKPLFGLLVLFVAGSLLLNGYHIYRDFMKVHPLDFLAGLESRDAFLARMIPTYPMYRFVNQQLPPESRVFLIYMKNFTFLCQRDCYADAMFETYTLQKTLRRSTVPTEIRQFFGSKGFTHLLYDEAFLLGDLSPLAPEEKDLFLSFRERHCTRIAQSGTYRLDLLN
jgi:hypothetical protein